VRDEPPPFTAEHEVVLVPPPPSARTPRRLEAVERAVSARCSRTGGSRTRASAEPAALPDRASAPRLVVVAADADDRATRRLHDGWGFKTQAAVRPRASPSRQSPMSSRAGACRCPVSPGAVRTLGYGGSLAATRARPRRHPAVSQRTPDATLQSRHAARRRHGAAVLLLALVASACGRDGRVSMQPRLTPVTVALRERDARSRHRLLRRRRHQWRLGPH
jgi:hypothetical protein